MLSRLHRTNEEVSMSDDPHRSLPPEALDDWAAALRARFGLDDDDVPIGPILDLAGVVAHSVARPAAPVSAFVAGLVAGRAGGSRTEVEATLAQLAELAKGWSPS
jgi:hypothetical protein